MRRRVHTIWAILTSAMVAATGCHPQQPFYLHGDGDLSHYLGVSSEIEYPDVQSTTLEEVERAMPPYTLDNMNFENHWDLSLEEAIKNSLHNSKVMRSLGGRYVSSAFNNRAQTGDAPDALITQPDATRTVYDPAITETTPFTGVEYALSAFDAQWSSNLNYQKNDRQQNVRPQIPITSFFRQVFEQDTSTFNTQITKIAANGAQFSIRNNVIYDLNNNPTRQIPKDWNINYEASFNQPLLAGSGVEYNRIAGPFNPFQIIPGGAQQSPGFDGVLLARINVDISLADFERGVRDLVADTEQAYWELAFAWRNLETSNIALDSARTTWRKIYALFAEGAKGGSAAELAQAQEQFYQFKSQAQTLCNELFRAEGRLRYVMGVTATDGRMIRPSDKPTVAKVTFDWREITQEALARSVDLRRQKWRIKQQELQIIAAKNLLLPRLDLNGTYRWLGLGDQLLGNAHDFTPNDPFSLTGSSAIETLSSGQFQEWQLGLQGTMTLGFRKELATVRFYQLSLARERAKLQDQELEVSHQLTDAVRQLDFNYTLTETNFNRALSADKQVEAVSAAYEAGTLTLDQLLEAQRRRADAQTTFFRSLFDYQRGIMTVHLRKGSILEYNNVYLMEGPWPAKAKFDAHRLARERDASLYLNYGFTRPSVMTQGPVLQNRHLAGSPDMAEGVFSGAAPEELPGPSPESLPSPETTNSGELPEPQSMPAASAGQAFDWGGLGLENGVGAQSRDAAAAPDSEVGASLRQPRRVSALKKGPSPTVPSPTVANAAPVDQDGKVRNVKHQWKLVDGHATGETQTTGPALGPAATWQGLQR